MKKLLTLLAVLALLLCACGQKEEAQMQSPETTVPVTTAAPTTEPTTEPTTVPTTEATEPPQPWRENVLQCVNPFAAPIYDEHLLGSRCKRGQVTSVTFLDSMEAVPENAWDVSEAQDGRVMAWMDTTSGYDLYVAAEGGVSAPADCNCMFFDCKRLTEINFNDAFHTSDVTTMEGMFYHCPKLEELDLSGFDTTNTTNMLKMFSSAESLKSLDLSGFNTSNVTTMEEMFKNCSALQDLDISNWDTSNVTNMCRMFASADSLTELDLSSLDVSNVTNMEEMFAYCHNLEKLNVSGWNTSKVTNMKQMFYGPIVTELAVEDWDVSNVTNMEAMFDGVHLTSLDLSKWDTSKVENMNQMFSDLPYMENLELGEWEVDSIKTYKSFLGGDQMYKGQHYNYLFQK